MDYTKLHTLLISYHFEDNNYLDKYINLIIDNLSRTSERHLTQQHHIIPHHIYKHLNLSEDEFSNYTVNLLYTDHILAHFYLFHCASNENIKRANYCSLQFIIHNPYVPTNESDLVKKFPEYLKMYKEYCRLNSKLQIGLQSGEKNGFYGKHHTEAARQKMREHSPHLSGKNHPNYGKHLSEEAKSRIGNANRGRVKTESEKQKRLDTIEYHGGYGFWITDEYCAKLSKSLKGKNTHSKGRKHINNGVEAKMVTVEELDKYLSNGWVLGRIPFSEEIRKKFSEVQKGRAYSLGKIWVTNGTVNHSIFPEEFDKYCDLGYYRGRTLQPYTKVKKVG